VKTFSQTFWHSQHRLCDFGTKCYEPIWFFIRRTSMLRWVWNYKVFYGGLFSALTSKDRTRM